MASRKTTKPAARVTSSSGNVFADLKVSNPQEALAKAKLAHEIGEIIKGRQLTQVEAARILDVDQSKVSQLTRGRLSGFSVERLSRFLNALGRDVEYVVKEAPRSRKQGRTTVTIAG